MVRTMLGLGLLLTIALSIYETREPSERAEQLVEACWDAIRSTPSEPADCLQGVALDWAPELAGSSWDRATPKERERFQRALAVSMDRDLRETLAASGGPAGWKLELRQRQPLRLDYRFRDQSRERRLSVLMSSKSDVVLADLLWEGASVREHYRKLCRGHLSDYSLASLTAELSGSGAVVLADFEGEELGELPFGWKWRGFGEVGHKPYRVEEEAGNRFLRAEDRGENVMLYKEIRWDLEKYPYIAWRWRIRAVPQGADPRIEGKADSAAGIYLTYRRKLGLVPETVKFVWSLHLPEGGAFRRPGIGMPWTVVAGSGAPAQRWERFVFDASDVYRKTFGGEPGRRPLGFGLLSDANDTGGEAFADYDDILALANWPSPRTIRERLPLP